MPYIKPGDRIELDVRAREPQTPGELNYLITTLLIDYVRAQGPVRYFTLNEALGAVESAKLEFYRRMVAPYENGSIERNGDVYPNDPEPSQVGG